MKKDTMSKLKKLEELRRIALESEKKLFVDIGGCKVAVTTLGAKDKRIEAVAISPIAAVQVVEDIILKKKPSHVILSYGFDSLFDLYPELRKELEEYGEDTVGSLSAGEIYEAVKEYGLRHIILWKHAGLCTYDCILNRHIGVVAEDEQMQLMLGNAPALVALLKDFYAKEQRYYADNPDQLKWADSRVKTYFAGGVVSGQ